MNFTKYISIATAFFLSIGLANYQLGSYDVTNDYSIQFKTGKAEGSFKGLEGMVDFNKADLANSMIDVSVDVNTIQTGNEKKDDHALGKKWFDADKYPTMRFTSESILKSGTGYVAKGNLTVKDVTKNVEISFSSNRMSDQEYLQGRFRINRKDYNIKGSFFGFTVGKNVDVLLSIPANYSSQ